MYIYIDTTFTINSSSLIISLWQIVRSLLTGTATCVRAVIVRVGNLPHDVFETLLGVYHGDFHVHLYDDDCLDVLPLSETHWTSEV